MSLHKDSWTKSDSWKGAYGALESEVVSGDAFDPDYRFTGKERDDATGLDYFGARYYAARLGRWMNPDPLVVHAGDVSASANAFGYVRGNPIRLVDPTGLDDEEMPNDTEASSPADEFVQECSTDQPDGPNFTEDPQATPADSADGAPTAPDAAEGVEPRPARILDGPAGASAYDRFARTWNRVIDRVQQADRTTNLPVRGGPVSNPLAFFRAPEGRLAVAVAVISIAAGAPALRSGTAVRVVEQVDDVVHLAVQHGDDTIEAMANVAREGDTLFLRQVHIQGSAPGRVGVRGLFEMVRDLGRANGVKRVVIEGGRRTTGPPSMQGRFPRAITVRVK